MTPDEARYLAATEQRVANPFHLRWLLPTLLGRNVTAWRTAQIAALAALWGLVWAETGRWWSGALLLGCSGLTFNLRHPILVDLPALACAFGAAVAAGHGPWWTALAVVIAAGCIKESAPVFAAAFAWNPLLLVGLVPVAIRRAMHAGPDVLDEKNAWILAHPFRAAAKAHRKLPPALYVWPWGVLLAALAGADVRLVVVLGLAYGQLLVATDSVRLYQWAAPAMVLAAVPIIDGPWWPLLLILHLTNPFRTEGL